MQYYHIVLDARLEEKGKRIYFLSLDDSEEKVRTITDVYMKGKPFSLEEKMMYPSNIFKFSIFRSNEPTAKLMLPNKKTIADYKASECMPVGCCKIRCIGKSLIQGKVKDVVNCTQEFIPQLIARRRVKKSKV